jgi:hypothetical protein
MRRWGNGKGGTGKGGKREGEIGEERDGWRKELDPQPQKTGDAPGYNSWL